MFSDSKEKILKLVEDSYNRGAIDFSDSLLDTFRALSEEGVDVCSWSQVIELICAAKKNIGRHDNE